MSAAWRMSRPHPRGRRGRHDRGRQDPCVWQSSRGSPTLKNVRLPVSRYYMSGSGGGDAGQDIYRPSMSGRHCAASRRPASIRLTVRSPKADRWPSRTCAGRARKPPRQRLRTPASALPGTPGPRTTRPAPTSAPVRPGPRRRAAPSIWSTHPVRSGPHRTARHPRAAAGLRRTTSDFGVVRRAGTAEMIG